MAITFTPTGFKSEIFLISETQKLLLEHVFPSMKEIKDHRIPHFTALKDTSHFKSFNGAKAVIMVTAVMQLGMWCSQE